jgi:hypothetical protein
VHLLEGEVPSIDPVVRVFQDDGRLWVEYQLSEALGGQKVRALLQPVSETTFRLVGPLSDTGPIVEIEDGKVPRIRFSGGTSERIAE